jgi:hypothetical protein
MAIDTSTPLSRRALVGGALGALGATLAAAVARPLRVSATADSITYLNDENDETVLQAASESSGPGSGGGTGVWGRSASGPGVRGQSASNVGVSGESDLAAGVFGASTAAIGVHGYSSTGIGVRGESDDGRGGEFRGQRAQLRLRPSSQATHPKIGAKGDLSVDKNGRLWFCRGGTNWVRVA